MNNLIQQLNNAIKVEEAKIQNSCKNIDNRISVIELTRCLDHATIHNYLLKLQNAITLNDKQIFNFIATGFYDGLRLFYDDSVHQSGFPIYSSSGNQISWANSVLIKSGHIGYIKRFILLTEQGLFKVSKLGTKFYFTNQTPNPGRESLGTEDFYWWQNCAQLSKSETERMLDLKPIIEKQLFDEVEVCKDHFIKYGCTKELDEFYDLAGKEYRIQFHSNDSFPIDSTFGDFSFGEIISIMEALIGYSIKHKDHCLSLLKKTNYKINPWNIHTLPYRLDDLAESVSTHKGLEYYSVLKFLENITLNNENINVLGRDAGQSPPPLIKISKEHILRSAAGTLINPFSYLARALKLNYEKDYFKAVNKREEVFKQEFYQLFPLQSILKGSTNINLKESGKLITDIDAMLYDVNYKCLVLIQLKWYDDFGPSMKARFSMANNFMQQSIKWIDKVTSWIEMNDPKQLLERLDESSEIKNKEIENIHLWILGRNFSHFSDKEADKRAIFCSWYKLYKTVYEHPELKENLWDLSQFLEKNSLEHKEMPKIENQELQVGKYKFCIRMHE
jgi:hypothetical protein